LPISVFHNNGNVFSIRLNLSGSRLSPETKTNELNAVKMNLNIDVFSFKTLCIQFLFSFGC
jgi:hypothetical protein